jgi:hypothetical protein
MYRDEDETPVPSMRTIPPAVSSTPRPAIATKQESSWIWALATIGVMASAPFILRHVASVAEPNLSGENEQAAMGFESISTPDVSSLRTAVVRAARLTVRAGLAADGQPKTVSVVPRSAVTRVDGKAMVFVAEPDLHLLVATPVELGATEGDNQRVLSGLSAGQVVVTENVASLEHLATRR